jgi:dTDP-4-amino-4,6-dideoxygalactose transaminase
MNNADRSSKHALSQQSGKQMIPVNEPLIGEKEIEYVNECLRTGWISSAGRFIEEFEEKWTAYCGMKYGIAMSNGSTALQLPVDVALGVSRATCCTAGTQD